MCSSRGVEKPLIWCYPEWVTTFDQLFYVSLCSQGSRNSVDWTLWIAITMPTGSGKTPLFTFLTNILHDVQKKVQVTTAHPPWLLDEANFENKSLLGMYDVLSMFLRQINVYRGTGLSDSHDFIHILISLQWKVLDTCNWLVNINTIH